MSPQYVPESDPSKMAHAIAEETANKFPKYVEKIKGLEEKYPNAFQRNGDVVVLNNYQQGVPVVFEDIEGENQLKLCVFTNSGIYVLKSTDIAYEWVSSMQVSGKFIEMPKKLEQEMELTKGSAHDLDDLDDILRSYGGEEYLDRLNRVGS